MPTLWSPCPRRPWRGAAAILGAAALWLLATAGLRTLTMPDEGRYVGVAWEMLNSGHWLVPTLDGLPYFHKPPLFYWITAASMSLLGASEFAARLASWLGALAAVTSIFLLLRRHAGERAAAASAGVLATMPLFFLGAQFANMDMLVAGCITTAVTAFAEAALRGADAPRPRLALFVGHAALALGLLAKGLVGVALPALVMLAWLAPLRRWRTLRALLWWPALAASALLALPWFVSMQMRHAGFFDYFVVHHHLARFAGAGFNNVEPLWFYPAVLVLMTLPWPLAAALGGPRPPTPVAQASLQRLVYAWFGVVVVFFSLPQSKLIGYVLPALPPLAMWIGLRLANAQPSPGRRRTALRAAVVAAPLLCLASLAWVAQAFAPRSAQPLAKVLAAQRRADEPVVMLEVYPFDLAFHARLNEAPVVVDDWAAVAHTPRDDWRHELYDAARFAPLPDALRLVSADRLDAVLCSAAASWVVAPPALAGRHPWLDAAPLASTRNAALWKVGRDSAAGRARCASADVIAP